MRNLLLTGMGARFRDEIAQINASIEFLQEQKNSIVDDQQERTEEIYNDILGDEYFSE